MNPWSLVHDVGTGDFINAESFWSPERKAALEVMYHPVVWGPGSGSLIDAMKLCPDFAHVQHRQLSYPTERPPGAIPTMRDHCVSHLMTFHGSSFLKHALASLDGIKPDRPYVYIQPDTPKNGPACKRWITSGEWPFILRRLEDENLLGLVVNSPGGKSQVPEHDNILDFTGLTTFAESVELLKGSVGYFGVDSCFAILAVQILPVASIWVRCNNPYLVDNPWWTYPPAEDYSFLCPAFHLPRHRCAVRHDEENFYVIELKCNHGVPGKNGMRVYGPGSRVITSPEYSAHVVEAGNAFVVEDLEAA